MKKIYLATLGIIALILASGSLYLLTQKKTSTSQALRKEHANESAISWSTVATCAYSGPNWSTANKKQITFSIPSTLTIDSAAAQEHCLNLNSPGYPGYDLSKLLKLEATTPAAELTADLKNIFYVTSIKEADQITYSLFRADAMHHKLIKLDTFVSTMQQYAPASNFGYSTLPVLVTDKFIIYNWFIKNPTPYGNDLVHSDFLRGKVVSADNYNVLFASPCNTLFSVEFSTFDLAPDSNHLVINCYDGIYLSDWKTTHKIEFPSNVTVVKYPHFINNNRIEIQDISREYKGCLGSPTISVDLNGKILRELVVTNFWM